MGLLDNRAIGLVEDDTIMGESLCQSLALEGGSVHWWQLGQEAIDAIDGDRPLDALICDMRLPDISGEEVFRSFAQQVANLPVLFVTGYGDIDQAVKLMRSGAGDYITKPFQTAEFLERLGALIPEIEGGPYILGASPQMQEVEHYLRRLAPQTSPLFLTGETGVGKEVCTRYLQSIACPYEPLMAVNCAAIPADLLESQIFGHEKGAFTGAQARHLGYAERARAGILFLDEIAEMPFGLQAKLLRLIEDQSFYRLGGESPVSFRGRIVASTNQNLTKAVASGLFREDLLYRLNTFTIEVPPLRERDADISWLLDRFVHEFTSNADCRVRGISALAEEAALNHAWPGNVRELKNRVERAVALSLNERLMPADLFPTARAGEPNTISMPLSDFREAAEKRAIESAIKDCDGQIQEAARLLGISRTTLWEKMKRLEIRD